MRRRALLGLWGGLFTSGCLRLDQQTEEPSTGTTGRPPASTDITESDMGRTTATPVQSDPTGTTENHPGTATEHGTTASEPTENDPGTTTEDTTTASDPDDSSLNISDSWPQAGYDAANTGSTTATGVTDARVRWTQDIDVGGEVGGPVVADGKVIVNHTAALDPGTGEVRWESSFTGYRPTPAYVENLVVTGNESAVAAIDADTGTVVWSKPYETNGIAIHEGTIYARGSHNLTAIDLSGDERWQVRTPEGYRGRHEPACGGDIVCLSVYDTDGTNGDGRLVAFDLATGDEVWRYDAGAASKFAPLYTDGTVLFGGHSGTVRALDATSGTSQWSAATGEWVETSPAVADEIAYVGTADGTILGYDVESGDRVYEARNSGVRRYKGSIAVADDVIYGVTNRGTLTANDRESGDLLWIHELARVSPQTQWPAPVDDLVFVADGMGTVYAIEQAR